MCSIHLGLLGPLQIRRDGQPVTDLRSLKAAALLAYAILAGRPLSRRHLAELFWPRLSTARGRRELRRVLYDVNNHFSGLLVADRRTVAFSPEETTQLTLDVATFEALVASADVADLEQAAALYRGEVLEGLYLEGCLDFESWLATERERRQRQMAHLLERLAAIYESRADYGAALRAARRLLALDPWREETHRQVMVLLARSGRRSEALAQYERCCRLLDEELGVSPSGRTTTLYERLRTAGKVVQHNLPPRPLPFIGRQEELVKLVAMLTARETRLVTVTGPGGVGKTHLALQAAENAAAVFLDGAAFVSLASVARPGLLAGAITEALATAGFIPALPADRRPHDHLLVQLADRELLLLLDNMEHLLSAAPQLLALLQAAPGLTLLTTSRERLDMTWEQVLRLEGLAIPASADVADWETYSAPRLFLTAARRLHPELQATRENRAAITRICQLVDGLPLALELAAAWTRVQHCATIAARLARALRADEVSLLTGSEADRPRRHASLRAAFDHSWELLSAQEQRHFRRLGVFRGSFTAAAAKEVAGASWHSLASLVDKSLLRVVRSSRAGAAADRFQMHELLRHYAAERLAESGQRKMAMERHSQYYCRFLEEQAHSLRGSEQKSALKAVESELSDVLAAWEWVVKEGEPAALERALEGLHLFLLMRSRLEMGATMMAEAERCLARNPAAAGARVRLLACLAEYQMRMGDYDAAEANAERALELSRTAEDARGEAAARAVMARLAYNRGRYSRADEYSTASLALYEESGDRRGRGVCLSVMGLTAVVQAKYLEAGAEAGRPPAIRTEQLERAEGYFRQALQQFRALGDRFNESTTLHNLGYVQYVFGEASGERRHFEAALERFEQAAAIDRALGLPVPQRLNWLACTLAMLDEHDRASSLFFDALKLALSNQRLTEATDILGSIAHFIEWQAGRPGRAVSLFALVATHPATDARIRQWAGEQLEKARADLPAGNWAQAHARGRMLSLEDAAGLLLDEPQR